MHSYEEKMRAVELYLKYDLSAASVINELEQHIKKNKLPAKDQRVIPSHNNYIMVVVRLSATILHLRKQSKNRCGYLCEKAVLITRVIDLKESRFGSRRIWACSRRPTCAEAQDLTQQQGPSGQLLFQRAIALQRASSNRALG